MPSTYVRALLGVLVLVLAMGCAHVPPHVSLPALDIDDPSFAATISGHAETAPVPGNRLDVLLNGDQIFPAKLQAIAAAKKTITFAQYVFEEGSPAMDTARALAERCRAGVEVNVLLDAVGAIGLPAEYRQIMEDAGCRVEMYRPLASFALDRLNNRNHRRILVVDGRVGFTGGSGTSGKWAGNGHMDGHWRDTDVRLEGPVVAQLQGAFSENWLEATGIALGGEDYFPSPLEPKGRVEAQVVRSSPAGGSTAIYTMFLLAIAAAQRSIHITNPYFVPDDKMVDTLIEETGDVLGPFDLAALPIGSYMPREIARPVHLSPEEAVQASIDLRAAHFVGIHWGTFALAREPYDEAPKHVAAEVASAPCSRHRLDSRAGTDSHLVGRLARRDVNV
jgi:cardiolipin synthase